MTFRQTVLGLFVAATACAPSLAAQQGFTDAFPPEEFATRRAKVLARIGDGVAIMQGTTERPGESRLRQSNQFFYLTRVVEPRAWLILDGKSKRTTLFLAQSTPRREQMIGPYLGVNDASMRLTGIDVIAPRDSFASVLARIGAEGRVIFTSFKPEVLGSESAGDVQAFVRASKNDPWDGRISREEAFIGHVKAAAMKSEIKDLDPMLDTMRAVKSPREIAIIREATRLGGLAIMEVMRDAEPGIYEYELEAAAEYVYKRGGAIGESYFPLIAAGRNMPYSHYHKNRAQLKDGDLVQFDWAPDLSNYTTDSSIKHAAEVFVQRYRRNPDGSGLRAGLGHSVGMEVHDVRNPTLTLEPGYVFTIEPQMTTASGDLSVRLEDLILMTDTGYENMSAFIPIEIADIERLMLQPGLGAHALKRGVVGIGRPRH